MTRTHRILRRMLWEAATAAGWSARIEVLDRRRRVDVLVAQRHGAPVALEAQCSPTDLVQRSDDYLARGIWPLWFFPVVAGAREHDLWLRETGREDAPLVMRIEVVRS